MRTIFMGTPDFAAASLEALVKAGHDVVCAVSQPDAAKDRGKKIKYPPVKEKALEHGIRVLQPEKIRDDDVIEELRDMQPDIIVVAAYGKILPKQILDLPKYGCINVHASLLPKYRGSAPIQHAILNGEEVTGVTIMQMAEGMDTGDMISKVSVPVGHKNCEQLHDELAQAGAKLLTQTMTKIGDGTAVREVQDDELATYAPMIKKQDGLIDFSASAVSIERKTRAFYPWPGSFTKLNGEMFKIWRAETEEDPGGNSHRAAGPGTVLSADPEGIRVQTGDGVLKLTEIQTPGKRRMKTEEWLKGNNIEIHTVLG
jgi:methionyl-tRNA formyltransferase